MRNLPACSGPIDDWLADWRECFINAGDAMWPSTHGGPLAYTCVGEIITRTTERELSVAVNPHLFRDSAVYTIAHTAGHEMHVASALLQHTDPRITERHYNRGSRIKAAKAFQRLIEALEETT